MKHVKKIVTVLMLSLVLTACGGAGETDALQNENSTLKAEQETLQAEKDALLQEKDTLLEKNEQLESTLTATESANQDLQTQLDEANAQLSSLEEDLSKVQNDLESVTDEYSSYKEEMSEYEGLSEAEAQARQIEADRIIAEEEAEKERLAEEERLAQEQAAREAEEKEKLGYETGITYEQLARTPDTYKGEKVKFTGEVIQVLEGDTETEIRLAVHKNNYGWYDSDQILYCGFDPAILDFRLLEDDIITIYGYSLGLISYESVTGATITLPAVWIDKIELEE